MPEGRRLCSNIFSWHRYTHDNVIRWKLFPRYWPFVWVNNRDTGVMTSLYIHMFLKHHIINCLNIRYPRWGLAFPSAKMRRIIYVLAYLDKTRQIFNIPIVWFSWLGDLGTFRTPQISIKRIHLSIVTMVTIMTNSDTFLIKYMQRNKMLALWQYQTALWNLDLVLCLHNKYTRGWFRFDLNKL